MKLAIFLIMLFNTGCAIHERNAYLEAENKALRSIVETDEIDLSKHPEFEIHESSRGPLRIHPKEDVCIQRAVVSVIRSMSCQMLKSAEIKSPPLASIQIVILQPVPSRNT